MARWRLNEDHYIHAQAYGQPTEWEYKETNRMNGREMRTRFKVPLYCERGLIVCYAGSELPTDNGVMINNQMMYNPIVFEGSPTPAMEPIDDEAKAINAKHEKDWVHPIDSLSGTFSTSELLASLQTQLAAAMTNSAPSKAMAVEGVSKEEFEALKEQMAQLMARNAELESKPAPGRRRTA